MLRTARDAFKMHQNTPWRARTRLWQPSHPFDCQRKTTNGCVGGFSFCLAPHWRSELPHTQNARIMCGWTFRIQTVVDVEEQNFWWYYKVTFYYYGKLGVCLHTKERTSDQLVRRTRVQFLSKNKWFTFCWNSNLVPIGTQNTKGIRT